MNGNDLSANFKRKDLKPGYYGIDIPTRPYIRAFIHSRMGPQPIMNGLDDYGIGRYFLLLLKNKKNYDKKKFAKKGYTDTMRIYINMYTFNKRGCNLHETNIRDFNLFVRDKVKSRLYELMDDYIEICNSFNVALSFTRRKLEISDDDWDDDSIRRDYHRYRVRNNLPLIYNKISGENVRFENAKIFD
ncbi:MAG TPA: hypothetical protein PL045_04370 [Chitinophagaceae bacterium]|nr:hypothetical protein [Chitinophagaceae bacterium]